MNMLSKKQKIIVIILGILGVLVVGYYYINSTKDIYGLEDFKTEDIEEATVQDKEEEKENIIVIHVTGAVKDPGIVKVKEDARINDVIEAAGGLADNANLSKVNLAYVVEDGQKIYIPYEKEEEDSIEDGEVLVQSAGDEVIESNESHELGVININTATQEILTNLPGIRKLYCIKDYQL